MFENLFKSNKKSYRKLVLQKSILGSIASERTYFDFICSWNGASVYLDNDLLSLTFSDGKKLDIQLKFYERDNPMIVRTGILEGNFPFRIISLENNIDNFTIGSLNGSGFGVIFSTCEMPTPSERKSDFIQFEHQYISFFQEKVGIINQKRGKLLISVFEELVINFACFEILCLRRKGIYNSNTETKLISDITNVAKKIISEYDDSHASIAKIQIPTNCNWNGMWEHLRKYFKNNFNNNI